MFTKVQIQAMKEAEFQNSVLIPLFKAKGFHDVTAFGGGSIEKGKDIVMWKEGELGERVNYGVVVKAVKVSGKAKGPNTANEVLTQIRQCLTSSYADPVTAQEQHIQRCFVVSSQIIEKTAMYSIEEQLRDGHFDKLVIWMHPGQNLFEQIEKFLPHQGVIEKLSDVQRELDEAMKIVPYKIVATSDQTFSLVPKHDNAHEELPFIVKSKFAFDRSTPAGTRTENQFLDHFKRGTPVEVSGEHIVELEFPEFLPDWMKPKITKDGKLFLKQVRNDSIIPLEIERVLADGSIVTSGRLDFQIDQAGTEEITLKNDNQSTVLQLTFVVKIITGTFTLNFNCPPHGFNVSEHLKAFNLIDALSKEGVMNIKFSDSGLSLIKEHPGKLPLNIDIQPALKLLNALAAIQQRVGVPMFMPKRRLTQEDMANIFESYEIIQSNRLLFSTKIFEADIKLEDAEKSLPLFKDESYVYISMTNSIPTERQVFGNNIDFGTALICANATLTKKEYAAVETKINKREDPIHFNFLVNEEKLWLDFATTPPKSS